MVVVIFLENIFFVVGVGLGYKLLYSRNKFTWESFNGIVSDYFKIIPTNGYMNAKLEDLECIESCDRFCLCKNTIVEDIKQSKMLPK